MSFRGLAPSADTVIARPPRASQARRFREQVAILEARLAELGAGLDTLSDGYCSALAQAQTAQARDDARFYARLVRTLGDTIEEIRSEVQRLTCPEPEPAPAGQGPHRQ